MKANVLKCPAGRRPLHKLPLGAVRPAGWLRHQLDLMVGGMTGRLSEISKYLAPENGWLGGEGEGWEEQPYWLRGFYSLAALTGDERCLVEARRWMEAVLTSQTPEGYFGARFHRRLRRPDGSHACDLWPHMVMLDAVVRHHEFTGDARVVPFMERFFEFCRRLPDDEFLPGPVPSDDWKIKRVQVQRRRAGDMLEPIRWLHERTGHPWLVELAARFNQRTARPEDEWLSRHVVDFTQRFRYPAEYGALVGDPRLLALTEYWYGQHLGTWGQQPRGIFCADEMLRPGKVDPRQGFETCGMTEFAKSFHILGRLTGDARWADRCEDVMLNHFPAAQTPDLKALHYLTASNLPQLDKAGGHDFFNKYRQLDYSPYEVYRCCQHNVAMGWPWHAENLWQATSDGGLAAWLYAAGEVSAKVGAGGAGVTVRSATDYPFGGLVEMEIASGEAEFPLYLRVPGWCRGFAARVNGAAVEAAAGPGEYLRIERAWKQGDRVSVEMPMAVSLTRWPRTGAVTVDRGPLSYSVRIEEDWRRFGDSEAWPEWEVFPATPWNYGLALDAHEPAAGLEVVERGIPAGQPWTVEAAPVEIHARGRRISAWRIEENQTVGPLPESPVRSSEPEERVRMIPLGCARLRMSCLPVIGDSRNSRLPRAQQIHTAEETCAIKQQERSWP